MMPDYEKMYHIVCSGASRALDHLPETAENLLTRAILLWALDEAEDMYIEADGEAEA